MAANMCVETVSGRLVDPINPSMNDISIEDIAWALSRIPRFAGHTTCQIPYNVAQHSVHVSLLVQKHVSENWEHYPELRSISDIVLKALLHDAHEAYIGDIPSPIKHLDGLRERFKEIENGLDRAIFGAIGLVPFTQIEKDIIKQADLLALSIEGYHFMPSKGANWNLPAPNALQLNAIMAPMPAIDAYEFFIKRYESLGGP